MIKNLSYENAEVAICYAYHAKIVQKKGRKGFCDPNRTNFTRKSVIMIRLEIAKGVCDPLCEFLGLLRSLMRTTFAHISQNVIFWIATSKKTFLFIKILKNFINIKCRACS